MENLFILFFLYPPRKRRFSSCATSFSHRWKLFLSSLSSSVTGGSVWKPHDDSVVVFYWPCLENIINFPFARRRNHILHVPFINYSWWRRLSFCDEWITCRRCSFALSKTKTHKHTLCIMSLAILCYLPAMLSVSWTSRNFLIKIIRRWCRLSQTFPQFSCVYLSQLKHVPHVIWRP